ncbi:DNA replication protein DnaC [Streptomyces luteogriseus]|uniref:DNA replication protein DnaC n=1 Tax=Streptomyces luteogriseus TaxID=68233 RepID=A0A7W7DI24_9ACTN|nr:ATP-binding protein [Streptomyces luteogriseus]MBB4711156.1 DNA replication protein DnaC [Streptomyces luteogriseus]
MNQRSKLTVDFAGLGIPPGRYALPTPGAYDGYDRLERHFTGHLCLSDLTPDDVQFLRDHFAEQVTEHRRQAMDYFEARVPRRFNGVCPDEQATAWAEQFAANQHAVKSLLLVGPTGTGKTHYAWSLLGAVAETGTQVRWQMHTAADLYASLRPRDGEDSESTFERIANAHLLVLDDLGASKWTEWVEEITYRLINHRYEECLPSIFTSNLPPTELRDALGGRVASRLTEMCDRITLKGDDRRKGARS